MTYAPIVLFVYNRPDHTRRTIEALKKNVLAKESELIIFSDAPKSEKQFDPVRKVRDYIGEIDGMKSITIIERQENFGLARSILDGVTSVVNEYGSVIVLEDDLVTSPFFLQFMNDGLHRYEKNKDVASIHGYVYPIDNLPETFFVRGSDCWGWATWSEKWAMFEGDGAVLLDKLERGNLVKDFDLHGAYPFTRMLSDQISGKNDSWAIRWHASVFLENKFTLYPGKSLVANIGNDGSGTHCGVNDIFSIDPTVAKVEVHPIVVEENKFAAQKIEQYLNNQKNGIRERVRRFTTNVFRKLS